LAFAGTKGKPATLLLWLKEESKQRLQFFVSLRKQFGEHFRVGDDRHEICVAMPSGNNVDMQMFLNTCSGAAT